MHVKIRDGVVYAYCGALINYTNTSIVNAAEAVHEAVVNLLVDQGILQVVKSFKFKDIFSRYDTKLNEFQAVEEEFLSKNLKLCLFFPSPVTLIPETGLDKIFTVRMEQYEAEFLGAFDGWNTVPLDYMPESFTYNIKDLII